jgi:hypothetical protein
VAVAAFNDHWRHAKERVRALRAALAELSNARRRRTAGRISGTRLTDTIPRQAVSSNADKTA